MTFSMEGEKHPGSICLNSPDTMKCSQKIFVTKKKIGNQHLGCGVSFSSRENIDAVPVSF